jgi:WD40 repeat protein
LLPAALALLAFQTARVEAQPKEPPREPLPEGAAQRFGVSRPILRNNPTVALLGPKYVDFLAPTMTGGIRRYSLETGKPLDKNGIVDVGQVVVSADGKRAAVSRPGAVSVVEVATGRVLLAATPPLGVVFVDFPGVALNADGKVLAYGARTKDGGGSIIVWDVDRDEKIARLDTFQRAPVHPLLSPDGKIAVSFGGPPPPKEKQPGDKIAKKTPKTPVPPMPPFPPMPEPTAPESVRFAQVWEVGAETELFRAHVSGMGGSVVAATFGPDDLLAVSSGDGPIDLWHAATGKHLRTLLGRRGQGSCVAISPDGKTIASVAIDHSVQRWKSDGTPLGTIDSTHDVLRVPPSGLVFPDNERVVAWATAAQFAIAWEVPSGKLLSPMTDHCAQIHSIAFPIDDKGLKEPLTTGLDGKCLRWDLATGNVGEEVNFRPDRLPGEELRRPIIRLTADGRWGNWHKPHLEVFDASTGEDKFGIPPPSVPVSQSAFGTRSNGIKVTAESGQSPGKTMGMAVVWDLDGQKRDGEFEVPGTAEGTPPAVVLSRDGKWLISGAPRQVPQGNVVSYTPIELKTGKTQPTVDDPTGSGRMTFIHGDESTVITASSLGRIWTVDFLKGTIGPDIDRILVQGEPALTDLAVSPDGKLLAVGIVDEPFVRYGVRVYDWKARKVLHTFTGHAAPVTVLRFTPDGTLLASGSQDTSVLVWDLRKLKKAE